METELKALCCRYVDKLKGKDSESALHTLMELPNKAIPILMELYRSQDSQEIKQDIVHSIWQHRDQDALLWLIGILEKEESELIWQEALDGIITLKGTRELAKISTKNPEKAFSIQEAIELIEDGYA